MLVRVGGPNAGHTVYGDPPRTYYHIPAGTDRAEGAKVVLGPGAVLWLPELIKEIVESGLTPDRLFIDPQAMIIRQADRNFEEKTLRDTIGSTAQGVGCATARKVLRGSWRRPVNLAKDTSQLQDYLAEFGKYLYYDDVAKHYRVDRKAHRMKRSVAHSRRRYASASIPLPNWRGEVPHDVGYKNCRAGLAGGGANLCLTQAFRVSPVGLLAPLEYTALLWGLLFGYVFWGEVPDAQMLAGAAVVVASGLAVIERPTTMARPR